jgi:hypothetical protein
MFHDDIGYHHPLALVLTKGAHGAFFNLSLLFPPNKNVTFEKVNCMSSDELLTLSGSLPSGGTRQSLDRAACAVLDGAPYIGGALFPRRRGHAGK